VGDDIVGDEKTAGHELGEDQIEIGQVLGTVCVEEDEVEGAGEGG